MKSKEWKCFYYPQLVLQDTVNLLTTFHPLKYISGRILNDNNLNGSISETIETVHTLEVM